MNSDDDEIIRPAAQNLDAVETSSVLRGSAVLPAGTIIDARYELISFLGNGGTSSVYKARQLMMEREVALKLLDEKLKANEEAIQRFKREAMLVSQIEHPNIVKVYGFGIFEDTPYIAMEYLDGISLSERLKRDNRLSPQKALPLFDQILDALSAAHAKGLIHRDLKPSNIMLVGPDRNTVKLVDFGTAKILPGTSKEIQKLTQSGGLPGTILYMSPEQCNAEPIDLRSDIYSAGCLMYEVIDGEPPLQGNTPYETLSKQVNEAPRQSDYLTGELRSAILAALEKAPAQRPQSAEQLKKALYDSGALPAISRPKKRQRKIDTRALIAIFLFVAAAFLITTKIAMVRK